MNASLFFTQTPVAFQLLDKEASARGLKYVLTGVELSNAAAVEWLARKQFQPYVCVFSRPIEP